MQKINKKIVYINSEIGQCAEILGTQLAPKIISNTIGEVKKKLVKTIVCLTEKRKLDAITDLVNFSKLLANETQNAIKLGYFPIIIGGDHSVAIGTWTGVARIYDEIGLIWIDAHLDMHTTKTSESGNLHGTPIATLLGYGEANLTAFAKNNAYLKPENIFFIAIRSFENSELELAKKLGCNIVYANDVEKLGIGCFLTKATDYFLAKNIKFGLSFDVDSLDPSVINATGTPVKDGLKLKDTCQALTNMDKQNLVAFEIVEYNPTLESNYEEFKSGKENLKGVEIVKKILKCVDNEIT